MEPPDPPASSPATTPQALLHSKPRKSRGRGLRTNTGCAVCRQRHMKCDEVLPVCGPCARTRRDCFYAPPSSENSRRRKSNVSDVTSPSLQPESRASVSSKSEAQRPSPHTSQGPASTTPTADDSLPTTKPESGYKKTAVPGTETATLRCLEVSAEDAAEGSLDPLSLERLDTPGLAQWHGLRRGGVTGQRPPSRLLAGVTESVAVPASSRMLPTSAASLASLGRLPAADSKGVEWQSADLLRLTARERTIFHRYVTGVATWIDLFDPDSYYSSFVPHLALRNEGLMKAVLALGARHLSIKPLNSEDVNVYRTDAVQYYDKALQYLQSAMRFPSYTDSPQFLTTSLVVSKYEMIDGAGQEWERHLNGVFLIHRGRGINGESGGLEQATWWAWLRQDVWAAFREQRRCFSFFKPRMPYPDMSVWDMASRIVYLLAQSVNYASREDKLSGETNLGTRITRGADLLRSLDDWRHAISVQFEPLPDNDSSDGVFKPLWIHPPALGAALQMYCMAKILLLSNQPVVSGYLEYLGRNKLIIECIDTIGGIALRLSNDACRLVSTQCLFAAGLYCMDDAKRTCIVDLILDHQNHTGWPSNHNLAEELRAKWAAPTPF